MTPKPPECSEPASLSTTYKAVFLDLDGTLLRSDHQLSPTTVQYIRQLDARGFFVAIATGRDISTVYEHIHRLNLPHSMPVVCSNGARGLLCDIVDRNIDDEAPTLTAQENVRISKVLFQTPVPRAIAQQVIALSKSLGCCCQFYVDQRIYADPRHEKHYKYTDRYQRLTGCQTIYVDDDFEEALQVGLPSKMLVLCPDPDTVLELFRAYFGKQYPDDKDRPTLVRGAWFVEVLRPAICKGVGLENMCANFDLQLSDVIAFGDGDNDLEFIQTAGHGIVMKNGRDAVKKAGDRVLDLTNDDDGVIRTLQEMESQGQLEFGSGLAARSE